MQKVFIYKCVVCTSVYKSVYTSVYKFVRCVQAYNKSDTHCSSTLKLVLSCGPRTQLVCAAARGDAVVSVSVLVLYGLLCFFASQTDGQTGP